MYRARKIFKTRMILLCRGGVQVVSVLALYSDELSLNTAEAYSFICKILISKEHKINKKRLR